jgi:undecaprenyl-diphosphatase|tara:strand:+ start:1110 stop:1895 length:786 start_codon:yes stop_codon:yes gene_type:complete
VEVLNAIILGIIQGLTEFLPVSSSGHLEIAKFLLGENKLANESLLMTVVLHCATAFSTIVIFRKEILEIFKGLLSFNNNESFWFSVKIIISMIPAAIIGFFFDSEVELLFNGNLTIVGIMLIVTGLLLFMADKAKVTEKKINLKTAFLIGISQAIAIIPGISRSGATISTAVLLGIDKENSAKFSFLMVVPLILGKVSKDILDSENLISDQSLYPLLIGFIFAFITGIFACKWMIKLVKNSKLKYFSYYCFIIGLTVIILS